MNGALNLCYVIILSESVSFQILSYNKKNEYIWKVGYEAFECTWYVQKFVKYYVIPLWEMLCYVPCDTLTIWIVSSLSFLVLSDNP